jgi:hypothetical protein
MLEGVPNGRVIESDPSRSQGFDRCRSILWLPNIEVARY